jgi:hypothetical protein
MYQFQIIDRDIPLQFVQKTLSILDLEQAVPILSIWTTNDPGIHPSNMVKVIITSVGYVYFCPYEDTKANKQTAITAASIVPVHQEDNHEDVNMDEEHWKIARQTISNAYKKAKHKIEFFIGRNIRKSFVDTAYEGRVAYHHDLYYRVNYDDGDIDDMNESEIRNHMAQYMVHMKILTKVPSPNKSKHIQTKILPKLGTSRKSTKYSRLTVLSFMETYSPISPHQNIV